MFRYFLFQVFFNINNDDDDDDDDNFILISNRSSRAGVLLIGEIVNQINQFRDTISVCIGAKSLRFKVHGFHPGDLVNRKGDREIRYVSGIRETPG